MQNEKDFIEQVEEKNPATNSVESVDWDAPAKLMNGELTHTLTGDIVGEVSEELFNAMTIKMAQYLREEIISALAISKDEKGVGVSIGTIVCNRIRVAAELMDIHTITRRDAIMALAGVFAAKDELRIRNFGKMLNDVATKD